jgi:hypothetical protein
MLWGRNRDLNPEDDVDHETWEKDFTIGQNLGGMGDD